MNELDDFVKRLQNIKSQFDDIKLQNSQLQKEIDIHYLYLSKLKAEQKDLQTEEKRLKKTIKESKREKDLMIMTVEEERESLTVIKLQYQREKSERKRLEKSYSEMQYILESIHSQVKPQQEQLTDLSDKVNQMTKLKQKEYEEWIVQSKRVEEYKATIGQLKKDIQLIKSIITEAMNEARGKATTTRKII